MIERGLAAYILKRLGFAALMLVGVSIVLFAIMRVAPGGPEAVLVGGEFSPEAAARVRQRLGLDRPLVAQYAGWAGAALRGDLGRSFKTTNCLESVNALVEERCAKVDAWKTSHQRHRWLATALLDIEPRLRRVKGHQHLPKLQAGLRRVLNIKSDVVREKQAA